MCLSTGADYLKKNGVGTLWQSMMRFPAGALTLNNYPATLRNITPEVLGPDGETKKLSPTDMAAMEIYRDRERGVPRYNEFRKWCAPQGLSLYCLRPSHALVE
jgi:alpha-dioxygenase